MEHYTALISGLCGKGPSGAGSYRGQMYDYFAAELPKLTDQELSQVYDYMRSIRAGIKHG